MLNHLKNATKSTQGLTYTENGAVAHSTTGSALLDFFAQAGAVRTLSAIEKANLFDGAFNEDALLALKSMFYFRDIRKGQGERQLFRDLIKHLAHTNPDVMAKNIGLIPFFGRWDDLYALDNTVLEVNAYALIKEQFEKDLVSENPSLLGKWLKSENASSHETKRLATKTRKFLGLDSKTYRKSLTSLRSKIKIVETLMSENEWSKIDYDKLPSKAGLQYRNAFFRHDDERYKAFLEQVSNGEKKINAGALYPYDILAKIPDIWGNYMHGFSHADALALDVLWNALPDYFNGNHEDSLVVADTSGSMSGLPIQVAVSLAIYLAERNKGLFHNHFISFSVRPTLHEVVGKTIVDKAKNLARTDWDGNTNVEAVFDLILDTAVKNNLPQDQMVKKLYIISDMEFDAATGNYNYGWNRRDDSQDQVTLFQTIRQKFARHGYNMPALVFWNVNARNKQFPVTMNEAGVQLVSGASPSIIAKLFSNKSAYDTMLEVLNDERYNVVTI